MDPEALATTEPFVLELRALLHDIDPARLQKARLHTLRTRLVSLQERLSSWLLSARLHPSLQPLTDAVTDVTRVLDTVPAAEGGTRAVKRAWRAFRKALLEAFERWREALTAWDIHVPELRPTNYTRNFFHVGNALIGATILGLYPDRTVLLAIITPIALWAWSMEALRRHSTWLNERLMAVFAPVAHPHEWYRVNSATWYSTALFILALARHPHANMVALVLLGVGDPAAAIVGRRFGRHRLANGRSLEGSLAFVGAGFLASAIATALTFGNAGDLRVLAVILTACVAGALAELFSRRIDDNLSIPLTAAATASLLFAWIA